MVSKNIGFQFSIGLMAISLSLARSRKAAQQAAVSAANNPAQCPAPLAGKSFSADTTKSTMTIDVNEDKSKKLLVLAFNGIEMVPVDGKQEKQANGTELVASCVGNSFKMAGTVLKGGDFLATLKPAQDGGLEFDEDRPERVSIHYTQTGPVAALLQNWYTTFTDGVKKGLQLITQNPNAAKTTGIPTKDDLKPDQPKSDQTKVDDTKKDLNDKANQLKDDANKKADELKNDLNNKKNEINN